MAIKEPLMFITIEEFKNWKGFNKLEFDDTTTPDNEIWFAISVASNNIDYLSGHSISKKWPETTLTEFTDEIQTATAYYVRFLLTKDSNYIRGQSSISQGGMTYSETNPTDPYFIVPEVFNCLRKIKEYPNITGFNLDVLPKRNDFFSNFYSNYGEDSPFTRYLELINLKTNDTRVKIYPKNPKYLIGTQLWIDTTGIKSFDNLTTIELFTKYFSNDTMKLVDGKEGQEKKVISATGGKIDLSDYYKKSVFMKGYFTYKDDRDQLWINDVSNSSLAISLLLNNRYDRLETTNKTIVGAVNEINKKQVKENWKVIGKSINNRKYGDFNLAFNTLYRVIITWESPPFHQVNTRITVEFKTGNYLGGIHGSKIFLTKGLINNEEGILYLQLLDINKWQLILEGGNEKYANIFSLEELQNTVKVDIIQPIKITSHTLKINELKNNEINIELPNTPTPTPNIPQWKEVGTKVNINHIKYTFKSNTKYKIYYNFESQSSNKKFAFMSKEFLYGELNTDVQTLYWDKVNDRIIISLQMQNDTIAIVSDPTRYGQLLKLEELQE
ncbi:hypothetical protein [Spiroplasma endosymbiont of Villa modesta]|uniref:hypothetical protein n=1 Tax=Spiroplasma endosymbiont of Villa modesta TaxID=3066293 RepID=UPI00313EB7EA